MKINLEHFIKAHRLQFSDALEELTAGKKITHWMWFIFPIYTGLGESEKAHRYAINTLSEAQAFATHSYLGNNYQACMRAILRHSDKASEVILGEIDSWKFRASLTLFNAAIQNQEMIADINECLDHFYSSHKCQQTLDILANAGRPLPHDG